MKTARLCRAVESRKFKFSADRQIFAVTRMIANRLPWIRRQLINTQKRGVQLNPLGVPNPEAITFGESVGGKINSVLLFGKFKEKDLYDSVTNHNVNPFAVRDDRPVVGMFEVATGLNPVTKISFLCNLASVVLLILKGILFANNYGDFNFDAPVVVCYVLVIIQIFIEVGFEGDFYGILINLENGRVHYRTDNLLALFAIFAAALALFISSTIRNNANTVDFVVGEILTALSWTMLLVSSLIHVDHNFNMKTLIGGIFRPMLDRLEQHLILSNDGQFELESRISESVPIESIITTNAYMLTELKLTMATKLIFLLFASIVVLGCTAFYLIFYDNTDLLLFLVVCTVSIQFSNALLIAKYNDYMDRIEELTRHSYDLKVELFGVTFDSKLVGFIVVSGITEAFTIIVGQFKSKPVC